MEFLVLLLFLAAVIIESLMISRPISATISTDAAIVHYQLAKKVLTFWSSGFL